jgi:glycosyltransferase involved in cell wall biosynthesis
MENVVVLDKIEDASGVLDYLNAADVLLCPMRDLKETSTIVPSKVLEYFAVGKPVVCSGRGETEIVINDYMPGVMVQPSDPEALAEAILTLESNRHLYESSAKSARELAVRRYGLSVLSRRIETLVECCS